MQPLSKLSTLEEVKAEDNARVIKRFKVTEIVQSHPIALASIDNFALEELQSWYDLPHDDDIHTPNGDSLHPQQRMVHHIMNSERFFEGRMFFFHFHTFSRRFVFVLVNNNSSKQQILDAPFLYEALRKNAVEVVSIPAEQMQIYMEDFDPQREAFKHIGVLFSTGRCGSTLLTKALSLLPNLIALQEPDFILDIAAVTPVGNEFDPWPGDETEKKNLEKDLEEIFILCNWTQYASIASGNNQTYVIMKFRSMANCCISTYHSLIPTANLFFLHRDAKKTVASFYRLVCQFDRVLGNLMPSRFQRYNVKVAEQCNLSEAMKASDRTLCSFIFAASVWADGMLSAVEGRRVVGDHLTCLSFETLITKPLETITAIGRIIFGEGFEFKREEELKGVMKSDSQEGTLLSANNVNSPVVVIDQEVLSLVLLRVQNAFPEIFESSLETLHL